MHTSTQPRQPFQPARRAARRPARRAALSLLIAALFLVGLPLIVVVVAIVQEARSHPEAMLAALRPLPLLLAQTLGIAALVAMLSTLAALAPAWLVRRQRRALLPLLLVPLFAPSYLAYSGWQLLRSPGTWLGDWLERQSASSDWIALGVGRGLAIFGLTLWSWPLATILLAPAFGRVDPLAVQSMQVDGASRLRRACHILAMARGGILASFLTLTLVMVGSAVPFHLAQMPTYAIAAWTQLVETPGLLAPWAFCWPVVVVCVVSAVALARWARGGAVVEVGEVPEVLSRPVVVITAALWLAAVVGPLYLFAAHLHSWASIPRFIETSLQALAQSGLVAGGVALGTVVLAALGWWTWALRGRSFLGPVNLGLVFIGLTMPGILIGAAVARTLQSAENVSIMEAFSFALRDGPGALIWGHLARFGALGVLLGAMLAWSEARDVRDLRAVDGCGPWRGLWEFVGRANGGVVLAGALGVGLLSLYEIEATILLVPPGPGSLSHTILGYLHFAKDEQLCAAGVVVMGSGTVLATGAALLLSRRWSEGRPQGLASGRV